MQVKLTLGRGARVGRGLGKKLQGKLYPIAVRGKTYRFGIGYQPTRRERFEAMMKKQEARRARLKGIDLPSSSLEFPPLHQTFISAGFLDPNKGVNEQMYLLYSEDLLITLEGNKDGLFPLIREDPVEGFRNLDVMVITEDGGVDYTMFIRPCDPNGESNNWMVEDLPIIVNIEK